MIGSPAPRFRVARPSLNLDAATRFYTEALGLQVLARFDDHAGFDGVILGVPEWPYHLELTRRRDDPLVPRPTDEDLLVFYLPDHAAWGAMVRRVVATGATPVASSNPYWDACGITFADPDGYRIVLQNDDWPEHGAPPARPTA